MKDEFAKRRKQLMRQIGSSGILIVSAAPISHRNSDCEHAYRQQSDFYYLTGFDEPEAVAVFLPKRKAGEFVLFNRPKNRAEEIWTGLRAGQDKACSFYGADQSFPIKELKAKLPELLDNRQEIYYSLGINKRFDNLLLNTVNSVRRKRQSYPAFIDIAPILHDMRLIKTPAEITLMRKAADITANAHIRAMQFCKPGINEYQLEAEFVYECQRNGGRFQAYTPIVGSGENTCILHYTQNDQVINNGELVLIDAGCEYQNYASDVTRTFPANGKFSPEQSAVYDIVLEAQMAAIKAVKPGASSATYHEIALKILVQGLKDLKILKGDISSLIETRAYAPFYMHKAGHWLGLDVHDVGRYKVNGKWRVLEPGMTLTVEPGLYLSADIKGLAKRWHNIGVRIEDDILVTKNGPEVLTHKAPKKMAEIESLMGKK